MFYIASYSDISERKANEARIDYLAHHDPLTGLINRYNLENRLDQALRSAHRDDLRIAVMFIDMDRFKTINDTLGHHVGDQLLQLVARRLTACVREGDTVARLGGDEFTVILESITQPGDVPPIAQKIIAALAQPMLLDGQELVVTASIGISLYPHDSEEPDELIKCADAAMYAAKKEGRNRVRFFTAAMKDAGA
jgi:diguanylate cyclase (GGDEF)-like protein